MSKLPLQPAEREILDALNKLDKDIDKPFLQALGLSTSFRNEEAAKILMAEVDPIIQKTLAELNRLIDMQKKANREATQKLASGTGQHASAPAETASTLEEFTTTVRQNAEHAKQASELAGTASATAEKGGEVVNRVVSTMKEVTESSKKISDIIGVID